MEEATGSSLAKLAVANHDGFRFSLTADLHLTAMTFGYVIQKFLPLYSDPHFLSYFAPGIIQQFDMEHQ